MKNYLKLVNFELNRFMKIYLGLMGVTILSQLIGAYVVPKQYLNHAQETMVINSLTETEYVNNFGSLSLFDITQSGWVMGPIALCIVALIFYSFLIWYRDWFGKNTFIYRLLTLPTNRINLYFAKATAILLMTLGLVSLQLILFPLMDRILKWTVPDVFITNLSIHEAVSTFNYLSILFPPTFIDFVIHYGLGLLFIFVLFTALLLERSFGIRGIVLGISYCAFSLAIVLAPLIATEMLEKTFLYPMEYFFLELFLCIGLTVLSIILSHYLLQRKVTV